MGHGKHTQQGRARGQRWGTLDREADGLVHGMDELRSPGSHTAANARQAAHRPRDPGPQMLYPRGCWCGDDYGHDWPGKADGAPHPRG